MTAHEPVAHGLEELLLGNHRRYTSQDVVRIARVPRYRARRYWRAAGFARRGAADPAAHQRGHHVRNPRPGRGHDDGRPGRGQGGRAGQVRHQRRGHAVLRPSDRAGHLVVTKAAGGFSGARITHWPWRPGGHRGAVEELSGPGGVEADCLGIGLPEKHGGTGALDPVTLGLATETLAYGDVNVASAPVLSGLVASQLAENGQDAVVDEWLPQLIAGDVVAAIAVTEPSCGSDVSRLRTEARRVPGGWRIRGEKIAITLATAASVALVYAREPGSQGYRGISCLAVPLDAKGVTRTHTPGMGCLPLCWGQLSFDDAFVPEDHVVGEPGRGFAGAMEHFDFSRPALGLLCLGACV